jgi:SAM-dependent methyltransferase
VGAHRFNKRYGFYERYWSTGSAAPPEDDPTTPVRKRLLSWALARFLVIGDRPPKVLDAGCGTGEFTAFIRGLGFDVAGIDIAKAAIERARVLCPEVSFSVASLEEALPYPDGEFDAIWCTEVLEHIFDVHACLSEFNRVLRNEGILILTTPFHGLLKNLAIALVGFERHFNPYLSHIRFFTKRSLTECLSRAGFKPVLWRGIGRIWPLYKSFFVVARKVKPPAAPPEITG